MPDEELARRDGDDGGAWRRWGPYLSERAWGTVREDYSADGEAWTFFPHDHARSRAYRWSEDGLGGICDADQRLCLAFAFWNGQRPDPQGAHLRADGREGNHGEDAKEYWWYLDSTPTHSWMRWRYVYPQRPSPTRTCSRVNARRGRDEPEYELLDTGAFDDDRYWDIERRLREGRAGRPLHAPDRVRNAGPRRRRRCTCCRPCGSATAGRGTPARRAGRSRGRTGASWPATPRSATMTLAGDGAPEALFCDNETNTRRLWGAAAPPYPKDGINDHVVGGAATVEPGPHGDQGRPSGTGSRSSAGETAEVRLRLAPDARRPRPGWDADAGAPRPPRPTRSTPGWPRRPRRTRRS